MCLFVFIVYNQSAQDYANQIYSCQDHCWLNKHWYCKRCVDAFAVVDAGHVGVGDVADAANAGDTFVVVVVADADPVAADPVCAAVVAKAVGSVVVVVDIAVGVGNSV